jgi:hypothetical protein
VAHVEKNRNARQHGGELALDAGALILPGFPRAASEHRNVSRIVRSRVWQTAVFKSARSLREEQVPRVPLCQRQLGCCSGSLQPDDGHARSL